MKLVTTTATLAVAACLGFWLFASTGSPQTLNSASPLTYLVNFEITDLDPSTSYDASSVILSNVYEPLLWNTGDVGRSDTKPALAESYSKSPDGLTWTFRLRKGVRFHNGEELTSYAVKTSVERTRRLAQGAAWIWESVNEISTPDTLTVRFHLRYPAPLDLITASGYAAWIICPAAIRQEPEWFRSGRECGTGPYRLSRFDAARQTVLSPFNDYWNTERRAHLPAVVKTTLDPSTQIQLLRSGQADIAGSPGRDLLVPLTVDRTLRIVSGPSYQTLVGFLNTRKEPTAQKQIREAITKAIDYDAIVKEVYGPGTTRSQGAVHKSMWAHDPTLNPSQRNLDEAKRLLRDVKKPILPVTISYTAGDESEKKVAAIIQQSLTTIGLRASVSAYPWATQWERAKKLTTAPHIFLFYYWPSYPTPHDYLAGMFRTENPPVYNLSQYSNPQVDRLLDEAVRAAGVDRGQATSLYRRVQRMIVDDAAALFLGDLSSTFVIRSTIEGFSLNPAYPNVVFFGELIRR
jgi:peptide/nickel transport system substrate-binding protein